MAAPPTSVGACAPATFILANPAGLSCLDDSANVLGRIVELPPTAAPALPALSFDRKQVLFALTQGVDPKTGFGTDIYAVNLDGTDLHAVVPHESENVFYDTPRYDPTGTYLYFHRNAAVMQNGTYVGNESTIERLNVKNGERTRILTDAADPSISHDGKLITFIHLNKDGQNDNVWVANSDGSGAHVIFKDTFFYVQAPRFSPTTDDIVFCAAGHAAPKAGTGLPHDAHLGIPSEIFVVKADGTDLRSVAQTGDDTFPAWSLDGRRIAYVSTGGFFEMSATDFSIRTLASGQNFFFGDITWLK